MNHWTGSSANSHQLIRSDRSMITLFDDNLMAKQIQATHSPDGRKVDVKPLFYLVEDILRRATFQGLQAQLEIEDKTQQAGFLAMIEAISYTIDRTGCEISCKALSGTDAHDTTVALFNILSSYSWDAKLVMALAAFALNYGEFWLLAQSYTSNQLAKSMAILKQLPYIMEHTGPLKPRFDALNNLIKAMIDVTKCVIDFNDLPSAYISHDVHAFSTGLAHIPIAVYWTVRSVVACAAQISTLTTMGHEHAISTTESWELSTLAHKLKTIHDHLKKQLDMCYQHIEEKRDFESYQLLLRLFDATHVDNMKILKSLIYVKDDLQPLVDCSTKRRVSTEVLRMKNVLLLISDLNISQDELSTLEKIYSGSWQHAFGVHSQYEVAWIPIVDRSIKWTDPMQKQFEKLQRSMPWYAVYHPNLIEKGVTRFIKEVWHFKNKPILVVLDPQGRVASPNAIHMMWIWGSNAFPFTSSREEDLWKEQIWRIEHLVGSIDPAILNWIKEGKYIFVYGSDDIEWVRKFATTAKSVAAAARIPLELVYVGKSSKREQVRRVMETIEVEKLSYFWQDLTMVWFFWTRLESMLFSKVQLGRADDHDPVMQEIKKLLSYERDGGWALLSKGSEILVNGHGNTIVSTLSQYDIWTEHVPSKGFDLSFKDYYQELHGVAHPCCRFEFSAISGIAPERMTCPECPRYMEKFTTFCCCHDDRVPGTLF